MPMPVARALQQDVHSEESRSAAFCCAATGCRVSTERLGALQAEAADGDKPAFALALRSVILSDP